MSTIDTIEYCSSLEMAWSLHLLYDKNHAGYPGLASSDAGILAYAACLHIIMWMLLRSVNM